MKIRPERQNAKRCKQNRLQPVAFLYRLNKRKPEKEYEYGDVSERDGHTLLYIQRPNLIVKIPRETDPEEVGDEKPCGGF